MVSGAAGSRHPPLPSYMRSLLKRQRLRRIALITLSVITVLSLYVSPTTCFTTAVSSLYLVGSEPDRWLERAYRHSAKVQVLMPIDKKRVYKNPDFCRSLWSAVVNGYRVTLYNWEVEREDEFDTHRPKVTGLASILSSPHLLQSLDIFPQDLIFLVDSIDVILQLSPRVLIKRYSHLEQTTRGKTVTAASFNCWPNAFDSPACVSVPKSPMPDRMFFKDNAIIKPSMARFPIHSNSGLVLGSVSEMSGLFQKLKATLERPEYTWQYDQGAFNIHLSRGDLISDNTLSMFWCAEHDVRSLSLHHPNSLRPLSDANDASNSSRLFGSKYQYPFSLTSDDLPTERTIALDKRTSNVPVALHFNGIGAKAGFNRIWEEMWPSFSVVETAQWADEYLRIVMDDHRVEQQTVRHLCGRQLDLT